MPAAVIHTRNTRLGLQIGAGNIGWAIVMRRQPSRWRVEPGDPLDLARRAARDWNRRENGPFTLYTYLTAEAFAGSLAAADGRSRESHIVLVERIAAQLASEGVNVTICEVE